MAKKLVNIPKSIYQRKRGIVAGSLENPRSENLRPTHKNLHPRSPQWDACRLLSEKNFSLYTAANFFNTSQQQQQQARKEPPAAAGQ